jgi:hypothetical protein
VPRSDRKRSSSSRSDNAPSVATLKSVSSDRHLVCANRVVILRPRIEGPTRSLTPSIIQCRDAVDPHAMSLEFDEGDAIRRMDGARSSEMRRRLGELGGALLR